MGWNTTATDAAAKLHSIKYDVDLGNVSIIRKWTEIDATQLKTLSAAKVAEAAVTDPKVDNVKYTGAFYCNIIEDDALPDRSTTIYQKLTKTGDANELVAVTDIDAAHRETSTFKWHISLAEVTTFKAGYDEGSAGVRYQFRVTRDNSDGTYDVVGIKIEAIEQTLTEYTANQQSSQTASESKVLNTTDESKLPIGDVEAGKLKVRVVERKPDDTSDITLRKVSVTDQTAISYGKDAASSQLSTLHTQAESALSNPEQESGKIKKNQSTPTEGGRYRTAEDVKTSIDQTETSYADGAAESSANVLHTQNETPLTEPSAAAGTIVENTNIPTDYDRTRTNSKTRTAKNQATTSYMDSAARSSASVSNTQAAAPIGEPTAAAGEIKNSSNRPTDFGKTHTEAETVTVKNQTETSYADNAAESKTSVMNTEAAAPLGEPSAAAGEIKANTNIPTDAGKTRTEAETRTVKNQTATSYETTARETVTDALNTQGDALASPSPGAGEILEHANRPTQAGKNETHTKTRTAVNQETINYDKTASREVVETTNTAADAALIEPDDPSAGTVVSRENLSTPYKDRWQTKAVVATSNEVDTGWVSYTDRHGTSYYKSVQNAASVDVSDFTSATKNSVSAKKNEFQKFDYTLTRTAYSGSASGGDWDKFENTDLTITERQFATFGGLRYYFDVITTYDILQTRNGENAYDYIDHNENGGIYPLQGSGVRVIGSDYYIVKRVTAIAWPTVAGDWTEVEFP